VFGSAARGSDFDPETSDADILVTFEATPEHLTPLGQYFGLMDALAEALGRQVDFVERGAVKNPYLAARIDADRELIFEA